MPPTSIVSSSQRRRTDREAVFPASPVPVFGAALLALIAGCSGTGDEGTRSGSPAELVAASAEPVTERMLAGACLRNEAVSPPYEWGFKEDEFWIERKEAEPLPDELVELLLGEPVVTSWIRGTWALNGDEAMLELADISGAGRSGPSTASLPVAVADLLKITIGSVRYTVEEESAIEKEPNFLSGLPVAFKDSKSEQWGFKDPVSSEVTVPAIYERAWSFSKGGIACVWDGEPGIVDTNGEHLLRPYWIDNRPDAFVEGLARYVDENDRMGFFDPEGAILVPARWDYAEPFNDGIALVANGGTWKGKGAGRRYAGALWGAIDLSGHVVIQARYRFLERGEGNTFRSSPEGEWFRPGGSAALTRE